MVEFNNHVCRDCQQCFNRNEIFQLLPEEDLEYLNSHRAEVRFKKGEIIFKQGSPLTHIVIISDGLGKNPDGTY